jgi:F-type H+-transporting ATPase subunit b
MGWLLITFIIFVALIVKAIKKPLALYLETRSLDIRKAIEEGLNAKRESQKQLKIYEEKLRSLDDEVAKIKAVFLEQAQSEQIMKERITKEQSARILKDVDDTIRANVERAKNKLAEEVINSALFKAKTTLMEHHIPEVDAYLKKSLIQDIKNYSRGKPNHDE